MKRSTSFPRLRPVRNPPMTKKTNAAPTMKDVAAEAGVALGTVSKVFNHIPVGEAYRLRVEEAARKLGYQVNNYARGLKTNKTNTVALIWPNLRHPFFASLSDAIIGTLMKRGYRTIIAITNYDNTAEQQCIDLVRQNKVDGIIALTYNPNLEVDPQLPFVSIDRHFRAEIPCVASDNFGGGQLAAQKLLELGCKKLLFLRQDSNVAGEADKRRMGFEAVCRERQIEFDSLYLHNEAGFAPFEAFLASHTHDGVFDYDGIFCNTDRLCYEIQNRLKALGLRVPEDVQMIGFDGIHHFDSDDFYCSTIVQPVAQMAQTAVDLLLSTDRSSLPALICLPVRYQPGGTTRDCL